MTRIKAIEEAKNLVTGTGATVSVLRRGDEYQALSGLVAPPAGK